MNLIEVVFLFLIILINFLCLFIYKATKYIFLKKKSK